MTTATLEEQERRAYIEGRTAEAALLATAIDGVDQRILDLDWEVRNLKEDNEKLQRMVWSYEDGDV